VVETPEEEGAEEQVAEVVQAQQQQAC